MFKIYNIIVLIILCLVTIPSKAHVQHYENLNQIEFDIYRNNKSIGKHIFTFERSGDEISVKSEIKIMLRKYSIKDVSEFISKKENISKKIIYSYCISLKK